MDVVKIRVEHNRLFVLYYESRGFILVSVFYGTFFEEECVFDIAFVLKSA